MLRLIAKMTLMNKGMRNLKIAEILDSGDFAQLAQFDKAHLVSVIINRLYYGVYLIGKDKLFIKDNDMPDKIGHGTENLLNGVINNIDKAKRQKYLWVRLYGFYGDLQISNFAIKMHDIRNMYDYNADIDNTEALEDLNVCKHYADYLQLKLKELK